MKRGQRKKENRMHIFLFCFLLFTITLIILLLRTKENIYKGQAAVPVCQALPVTVPVVVVGYFPPNPSNPQQLDPVETGWTPQKLQYAGKTYVPSISEWETDVNQMASSMSQVISDATKYHGYKDPSAPRFLNYQIIDTKFFLQPIPHSTKVVETNGAVVPDYSAVMKAINVCNYIDTMGVKEIWIYGYHSSGGVAPAESFLQSKYGDISNNFGYSQQDLHFKAPLCNNSYIGYNFEMWPDPVFIDNTVHNRLHQIENEMQYSQNANSWPATPQNTPGTIFWGNYALALKDTPRPACGTTHVPPNTVTAYDYANTTPIQSNCETWNPDPTKSTFANVSCQNWGCTPLGYYTWWMQNLPGYNNGITFQGKPMRNWWEAMYDFNTFITNGGRSLFGNSIFSCLTTPTPSINPGSPIPSPTITSAPTPHIVCLPDPTCAANTKSLQLCALQCKQQN